MSYFKILRIHFVLCKVFNFDGAESSQTNMKYNRNNFDTLLLNFLNKTLREVEPCSRSCNSSVNFSIDGLVVFPVGWFRFSFDIRRQGSHTDFLNGLKDISRLIKPYGPST